MPADAVPLREGAQSIHRAVAILRTLAAGLAGGVSLQAVVEVTGISRPTVHRILQALIEERIVEQNPRSRRYAIGEQIPMLALARPRRSPLLRVAEPIIERAAREIGDTIFLTIRTGDDTLCVARRLGTYPIQVLVIDVGARRPLGVSSAGLAILAELPRAEARAMVLQNSTRFAAYRTDARRAIVRIESTQRRGFALSDPGLVSGTKAISAAFAATRSTPLGALTVAAIRQRLRPQRELELGEHLRALAADIVKGVGGSPP